MSNEAPIARYGFDHNLNVDTAEECREISQSVFNNIADVLEKSLGPYGSHALIARSDTQVSTKDGYHILCHLICMGPWENEIYHRMILKPCNTMNNEVGDGTTTVVLLTREMFNRYNEIYPKYVYEHPEVMLTKQPKNLYAALERAADEIATELQKVARPMTIDDVYNISMISSNGNTEISGFMKELYEKTDAPDITFSEDSNVGMRAEYSKGLKMPITIINPVYINDATTQTCNATDVAVLVSHHRIANAAYEHVISTLDNELSERGIRLMVVAPSYDDLFLKHTWKNKIANEIRNSTSHTVNTILAQYPNHPNAFFGAAGAEDFATMCDTVSLEMEEINTMHIRKADGVEIEKQPIYDEENNLVKDIIRVRVRTVEKPEGFLLGYVGNMSISREDGHFEELYPNQQLLDVQKEIAQTDINNIVSELSVTEKNISFKLEHAKKRLDRLNMRTCCIYYGATDALETQLMKDTLEDVVHAVESARACGVVYSTQTELIKIVAKLYRKYEHDGDIYNQFIYDVFYGGLRALINKLYRTHPLIENVVPRYTHKASVVEFHPDDIDSSKVTNVMQPLPIREGSFTNHESLPDDLRHKLDNIGYMLSNVYGEESMGNRAMELLPNKPFNLVTLERDETMVVSVNTDIQAIRCACDLLKILLSSNQLIKVDVPTAFK